MKSMNSSPLQLWYCMLQVGDSELLGAYDRENCPMRDDILKKLHLETSMPMSGCNEGIMTRWTCRFLFAPRRVRHEYFQPVFESQPLLVCRHRR